MKARSLFYAAAAAVALIAPTADAPAGFSGPTTIVASATGSTSGSTQTISSVTAPKGAVLVVVGSLTTSGTVSSVSVSDSQSNGYATQSESNPATSSGYGFVAFSRIDTALSGGTITISKVGTGSLASFAAAVFSFTGGTHNLDSSHAVANGTSGAPSVTGGTNTDGGDLLICATAYVWATGMTYTEDATDGWTNLVNINAGNGFAGLGAGYQRFPGTTGKTCAPTLSASAKWAILSMPQVPSHHQMGGTGSG